MEHVTYFKYKGVVIAHVDDTQFLVFNTKHINEPIWTRIDLILFGEWIRDVGEGLVSGMYPNAITIG